MPKKKTVKKKKVKAKPRKKKAKREKKESFYVQLDNHKEVRRDILQSAVESTKVLKGCERIEDIRKQKEKHKEKLRRVMKEISRLISHLKRVEMPLYTEVKEEIQKDGFVLKKEWEEAERKVKDKQEVEKLRKVEPKKAVSELDKDLGDIKARLSKLGF